MRLTPLGLPGVLLVEPEPLEDERGSFARTFDRQQWLDAGLDPHVEQCSVVRNHRAGTVRGMHWQAAPDLEAKLVRVTAGAVLDVVVDLRAGSPTRLRSVAVELSAAAGAALVVPPGFAHGYQTLVDATELSYQMSTPYAPASARGLRHDDPALGLSWPLPVSVVSARDRSWPLLSAGG